MQTSSLINMVRKTFNDWSREEILSVLNEVQKMVYTQRTTLPMLIIDTTTGKDPILTTTQGVYEYELTTTNGMPSDFWRATVVYSSDISSPEEVQTFDATTATNCKVVFREDPGTSEYYVQGYRLPSELTAETVQMEIPAGYHLSHVFEGVAGIIETMRSGRSERYMIFMKELLPEMVKQISENIPNSFSFTEYRGY